MKPLHVYFDSSFQIPQLDGLSDDQETDDENRSLMEWKRVRKKKKKAVTHPLPKDSTDKGIKRTGKKVGGCSRQCCFKIK